MPGRQGGPTSTLPVPGRELEGIHFAMDFLPQQNKVGAGDTVANQLVVTRKPAAQLAQLADDPALPAT